jgi:hypothetical protein
MRNGECTKAFVRAADLTTAEHFCFLVLQEHQLNQHLPLLRRTSGSAINDKLERVVHQVSRYLSPPLIDLRPAEGAEPRIGPPGFRPLKTRHIGFPLHFVELSALKARIRINAASLSLLMKGKMSTSNNSSDIYEHLGRAMRLLLEMSRSDETDFGD